MKIRELFRGDIERPIETSVCLQVGVFVSAEGGLLKDFQAQLRIIVETRL